MPFYCNICKFVTTRQGDLEKHIIGNSFSTHKATVDNMRAIGQEVNENESLFMNVQPYNLVPVVDYLRLSHEESDRIFSSRSRKSSVRQSVVNKENSPNQPIQIKTIPIESIVSYPKDVILVNSEQDWGNHNR